MGFKRLLLALWACSLFLVPCAGATQTIETTPVPLPPKPDFSSMQFLLGTWSCSTKSSRRPAPYISTTTYSMSSDGFWIDETTVTKPVAWVPQPPTVYDKITYDADTKRWIDVTYGGLGTYGLATSPGWTGNTMTWHDANFAPGADIKAQTDVVMTKVSATKTSQANSFTEASGRSISVAGTCTKGA